MAYRSAPLYEDVIWRTHLQPQDAGLAQAVRATIAEHREHLLEFIRLDEPAPLNAMTLAQWSSPNALSSLLAVYSDHIYRNQPTMIRENKPLISLWAQWYIGLMVPPLMLALLTEESAIAVSPEHFHVEYRTVSPATTSRPPSAASVVDSGAGGVPSGRTDGAGAPVQRPLATAAPADTAPVRQAQASPANGTRATRPSTADCPARLDKLAANVYFRTDSEALSKAEEDRLGTLGRCMRNRRISVVGFADSRHNSQYNLELSQRRAQAVAAAIRAEAPAGASIATSAVGAEAGKSSRDARWSRRVEFRVR